MKLEIERGRWLIGDKFSSCLLNGNGKQCCLGFLASKLGIPNELIDGVGEPDYGQTSVWPEILFYASTVNRKISRWNWADVLMMINDNPDVDYVTREEWIAAGFKILMDIDVEFTGEYP